MHEARISAVSQFIATRADSFSIRYKKSGSRCLLLARALLVIGLVVPFQMAHAQQELRQASIEGWSWSTGIYSDATDIQTKICVEDNETLNGRTELGEGGRTIELYCEYISGGNTIEYISYTIYWRAECQSGFSAVGYTSDPRPSIDYCVRTGYIAGQPEVCCETGGSNPILVSSRRKVQVETDYRGTGSFPLLFERTYTSGKAGAGLVSLSNTNLKVWYHTYERKLTGNLDGSGGSSNGGYFERIGYYWIPEPQTIGGDPGTNFNAYRPDGSVLFINGFSAASNQRTTLAPGSTLRGEPGFILTTPTDLREYYDQNGRLMELQARSGEAHYLTYADSGLLASVTDDYGNTLQFGYQNGLLSELIDPAGNLTQYTYNGASDFLSVDYPDTGTGGSTRTYRYEAAPRYLTGIVDERGQQYTSWGYSTNGNGVTLANLSTGPDGINQVQLERYANTDSVVVTNPLGLQTVHNFSVINGSRALTSKQRLATAYSEAATESRTYDTEGFLTSLTDWNGNTTLYERDIRGLPVRQTLAAGTADERTIMREWHPDFRLPLSETHPDYRVDYERDFRGNVLNRTVTDLATGESRSWAYSYDAFGKLQTVDGPREDVSDLINLSYYTCSTGGQCGRLSQITDALGFVTQFTDYNAHGQLTRSVDANGTVSTFTYNARRWLRAQTIDTATTSFTYDPVGNVTRVTLPDGTYTQYSWDVVNRLIGISDGAGNSINWTLDAAGNRTQETYSDPTDSVRFAKSRAFDALSRLIETSYSHGGNDRYEYDPNGNTLRMLDSADREESSTHDALDRLIRLRDALQGDTRFAYDSQDNLISVTDPEGETTTYTYNGFGDRLSQISPDSGTTTYTVDSAGNRISQTDARGVLQTTTYDALNRPTSVNYPDAAETILYVYDQGSNGIGRLSGITDESGSTQYDYDARGNVTRSVHTVNAQSYTVGYSYNTADRLTGITYPSGRSIAYAYDSSGRVASVTSTDGDGTVEVLATGIDRLPYGPMQSLTLGNGIERTHSYDLDYRVESLTDSGVLSRNYAWNSVSNITAIADGFNSDNSQLFTYDELDRLSFATGSYGEQGFTYDAVGNRLSLEQDDGAGTTSEAYLYGSSGHRLDAIVGQRTYTYDAAGNTLSDGQRSFNHNQRGRLSSVTAQGATTTYQHNALGQRVSKLAELGVTHFIYDLAGQLIAEADSAGDFVVEYAYLDAQPLAMWRDNATEPEPELPEPPTPLSPLDSVATAIPEFTWSPVEGALRYQLIVFDRSVGERVHNEQYAAESVCSATCAVIPADIALGFSANHFWRVRTSNSAGWGPWGEPVRFDYVDSAPGAVTAIAPMVSVDTATPAYQWESAPGVEEYQLIIFDRALGTQVHNERYEASAVCEPETNGDGASVCSLTPVGISLNYASNHFWRIRANNTGGWGGWSEPIRFDYVEATFGAVTPVAPMGNTGTATPSYQWQALTGASEYQLFIYDRSVAAEALRTTYAADLICAGQSCNVTPEGMTLGFSRNHFWRVRARNTGGWGAWTPAIRFDYVDDVPGVVQAQAPLNITETTDRPTYQWSPIEGVTEYQVIVFDRTVGAQILNERYAAPLTCIEGQAVCSLQQPDGIALTNNTNHFWRIRGFNSGGWGAWSEPYRFDVDTTVADEGEGQ